MQFIVLGFVLVTANINLVKTTCTASVPTIRYVTSCPSDEVSWRKAELRKNCESLADIQKCDDPSRFKYHCLVNNYLNATLEVCAPSRFVTDPACYKLKKNYDTIENSTQSAEYSTVKDFSTTTFVQNKPETRTIYVAVITLGVFLFITLFIGVSLAVYKLRKRFIFHQISKNPLDDTDAMLKLFNDDAEEAKRKIYRKEEIVDEERELEEEEDDVENKYYQLVPKEKSDFTDEEEVSMDKNATELLVSSNEESTKRFLENAISADSFYEETKVYKKVENVLLTNNVVILTGPPGFGKTQTAIHLMMPFREDWVIRKVENYVELNYVECAKNTIIFIDNIFYGKSNEFAKWMKPLDKLNTIIRSMDRKRAKLEDNRAGEINGQTTEGEIKEQIKEGEIKEQNKESEIKEQNKGRRIKVIITARSDKIEEACELMKKRAIFREDCIVNLSQYELENDEKKRILMKQFTFAHREKGIEPPDLKDLFWEGVAKSKAHIGFPLCAHLFAFEEAFRRKGEDFFSWPTQLVLTQIEDVVKNDKTNRVKTLLLFLLLLEIHNRNKDQKSKYKQDLIQNEKDCADFLKKSCRLGEHFQPLNFKKLPNVAADLTWSLLRKTGESSYQFIHQSVFDAVETYIFRSFPNKSIALLPLDVIEGQTNDKEGLTWMKDEHFRYLAKRFIAEVKCGKSSHICKCDILKRPEFIQFFCDAIFTLDDRDLVDFFTTKSVASPQLPIIFWLGRSECTQLLKTLIPIMEHKKINAVDHIYYFLFGECTKGESPESIVTDNKCKDYVKKIVLSFKDKTKNTILHILIQSKTVEDDFATKILKQLIHVEEDNIDINAKNIDRKTPLMLAVTWPLSRKHVIEELVKNDCDVKCKDRKENSVFHYCVDADTDDLTCANVINTLLSTKKKLLVDLSTDNTDGLTPLNLACKNTRNSRILSICSLLDYGDSSEPEDNTQNEKTHFSFKNGRRRVGEVQNSSEQVNKIDSEGRNPIFNVVSCLTGENELVEMERLLRVCILLLYGADPHIKSDDGDRSAITFCMEKSYCDLEAIMASMSNTCKNDKQKSTESLMINAITKGLKRLSKTHATGDHIDITMKFSNKIQISEEMKNVLSKAVHYLAKTRLNSS
ncbi:uncharacterized protein LOC133204001 [Saccostrea echinata]|uniref:uncharacterized protein LOC133204001 n=1 Tax=Saccostrea echinata TaxID=191078 RepID=UPI002A81143D|nr:uncharacterized protein LOC133204001 [Saccostrea echinata]